MKKNLHAHGFTFTALIVLSLLLALILATIRQAGGLAGNSYQVTLMASSAAIFFLCGLFLGFKVEKHGFAHALLFASCYLVIVFMILFLAANKGLTFDQMLISGGRAALLIIGTVIGRNLKGY